MPSNAFPNVLLVGATGLLGSHFADALLESDLKFNVRILIREAALKDEKKKAQLDGYVAKGATLVHGDLSEPSSLPAALKGIDLVISTLGGEGLFQTGDIELIRAAKAAGVKRFVPSYFGARVFDYKVGQLPFVDTKVRALEELRSSGLEFVAVATNGWTEFSLGINFSGWDIFQGNEALIPNDGNSVFSLTSVRDVPRLAIPAIVDPEVKNVEITVAGDSKTWNEIADIADRVLGKKITRNYVDAAKIDAIIETVSSPIGKFGLTIAKTYAAHPERSDFSKTAYNVVHPEKYGTFKPITIEQWLQNAAQKKQ